MDEDLPCYDMEKAMKYLQKAGDRENEYAQYRLGKIYLTPGYEDIDLAEKWLKASADQGNEYAAYSLGKMYMDEDLPCYDMEKAINIYKRRQIRKTNMRSIVLEKFILLRDMRI